MKTAHIYCITLLTMTSLILLNPAFGNDGSATDYSARILTPPPAATPRINGPNVFGVRPKSPFLYTIPATGYRPMKFSVNKLPPGLSVNAVTGRITGSLAKPG